MKKTTLTRFVYCFFGLCLLFALSACASAPAAGPAAGNSGQPDWVRDPYTKFDKLSYVAAVGNGNSRQAAEKNALGNLVAVFGQEIQVDEKLTVSYQEAVKNGITANWSETTINDSTISTSAGMDSLVGAEIGDVWEDGKGAFAAAAVLNKTKAAIVYRDMIAANQKMITNLVNIPADQKASLEGYSRYQFAAIVADINISYGNLLSVIGAPVQGLARGDDYRLEAKNITKAIPVGISVKNDKSNRIQGAFAKAFSDAGFQSGGSNSRYVLNADITSQPAVIQGNVNLFTRIEVAANLVDTSDGSVVLPYNFNLREGHTSQAEADNRAILSAERKIGAEYAKMLNDYLSRLLPKK
ncbi:MAG: LPP20 family lipoprotein [Treponema sp.]|nr:LPP20 family lipoprotein [Treponema sp.]